MIVIEYEKIKSRFESALSLDEGLHQALTEYLESTHREFICVKDRVFLSCDYYTKEGFTTKIFIIKTVDDIPKIIKMGNVLLFNQTGFTIIPEQAYQTLFEVI